MLPATFAILIWWFSTGVILVMVRAPRQSYGWSMAALSVMLVAALHGIRSVAPVADSASAAYASFACGILVWGWLELSYLTGYLTGPCKAPCPAGASFGLRFRMALATSLWHELAVVGAGLTLLALTWGQPNKVALWAYLVLWSMRWSAKLNLFLGVRNFNADWFPEHLKFLTTYLEKRTLNFLFPISVTLGSFVAGVVLTRALGTGDEFLRAAGLLTFMLLALALLEHWLLLLPVRGEALWDWLTSAGRNRRRAEKPAQQFRVMPGLES